ncbi:hypothetical protein G195_000111 [Phytophthora kernoviae 00238/432]|uniref:peptide-methionine (S)-S-oxide reductase n=1 Tax=Phytophthora kernoviae 00238/432 TaxID=1284355 RepID=A0A8J4SE36_9STRA|nr:hypothetical protein G195_000111 [Phytophthora kernoviae 00238/432]
MYYVEEAEKGMIQRVLGKEQDRYNAPIVTEVLPLQNFYEAEEYHQDYLEKNPQGYCHIDMGVLQEQSGSTSDSANNTNAIGEFSIDPADYPKHSQAELKQILTDAQYKVAVEEDTERAYSNEYWDTYDPGIYVDVSTGEPLFATAASYDLLFDVPDYIQKLYQNFGINLAEYNADAHWKLPVPATFMIDEHATIRSAYVNSDFMKRMEPNEILAELAKL